MLIQLIKFLYDVHSIEIGINLWLIPQISEHCPKKIPGRWDIRVIWLIRPGDASILIPRDGIVQEWITSMEVTNNRIGVIKGIITRLSTSNKRNWLILLLLLII